MKPELAALIDATKQEFNSAIQRLEHSLSTTPDDRLNWSPSPTARTPIQLVLHTADAIKMINDQLDGIPFPESDPAAADALFMANNRAEASRDQALERLKTNSRGFIEWLDNLTEAKLAGEMVLPFGLGRAPLTAAIGFVSMHTNYHIAQLDYVQTTYGDRDWHLG